VKARESDVLCVATYGESEAMEWLCDDTDTYADQSGAVHVDNSTTQD